VICYEIVCADKNAAVAEMGDRLATIDMGRKVGGAALSLSVGELGPHLTVSPGLRPTSVPSGILIHPTTWPQYNIVTDRQDNGLVAWGKLLLVTVAQTLLLFFCQC